MKAVSASWVAKAERIRLTALTGDGTPIQPVKVAKAGAYRPEQAVMDVLTQDSPMAGVNSSHLFRKEV